jgi:fumarate reductase flavoprotein subunit
VTGAIAHTQGGLRIDAGARVLREDNSPIAGLYAAGGTAAGMSGNGSGGYLSGNGLAHAFGTGLIAAETLVASLGAAGR